MVQKELIKIVIYLCNSAQKEQYGFFNRFVWDHKITVDFSSNRTNVVIHPLRQGCKSEGTIHLEHSFFGDLST